MQIGERIVIEGQEFRLEGILSTGVGSYGQVWAATDADGRAVALKFINTDAMLQADPSLHGHWRAHLEREVVFLQGLEADQSRHIVKLILAGLVNNQPVLVLERMSGNLDQWLTQRRRSGAPLPDLARILDWAEQILSGLDVLHQHGFVYRDLKFSNLLINEDGTLLKLADFGSITREDGDNTRSFIGTPTTMAPEQALPVCVGADGYEYRVDYRADYYALGLLLFTLLTGQPATAAQRRLSQLLVRHGQEGASQYREQLGGLSATEQSQLRQAIEFWTVPLSTVPGSGTAARLTALVERLLRRDAAERPDNSAEIRAVLDMVSAGQPVLAAAPSLPPTPALFDAELPPLVAPPHRHPQRANPAAHGDWSRRRTVGLVSVLGLFGAVAWAIIQPGSPRLDQAELPRAVLAPPAITPVAPPPGPESPPERSMPAASSLATQPPTTTPTAPAAPAVATRPPTPTAPAAPAIATRSPTPAAPAAVEPAPQNPPAETARTAAVPEPAAPASEPLAHTPAPGDDDGVGAPASGAAPAARTAPAVVETTRPAPATPARKAPARKPKPTPSPAVATPAPDEDKDDDDDEADRPAVVATPPARTPAAPTQSRTTSTRKSTLAPKTAKVAAPPPPVAEPASTPSPAPAPTSAPVVAKPTPKPATPDPNPPAPATAKTSVPRERPAPVQPTRTTRTASATRPPAPAPRPTASHETAPTGAHRPIRPRAPAATPDLPPIELTARSQAPQPTSAAAPPIKLVSRSEPAPVAVAPPPPAPAPAPVNVTARRRNPDPPAAPPARTGSPVSQFKEDAGKAATDIRHQAEAVGNWFSDTGKQIQRGLENANRTINNLTGTCDPANGCNSGGRVERRDRWANPHNAETSSRSQRSGSDDDGGYAPPPPRQAQY